MSVAIWVVLEVDPDLSHGPATGNPAPPSKLISISLPQSCKQAEAGNESAKSPFIHQPMTVRGTCTDEEVEAQEGGCPRSH